MKNRFEIYNKEVMKHFLKPKNIGKMQKPDAVGKVGNPVCGDVMYLYIKISKKNRKEYIKDIKFQTMGCIAAIATSSMITELAKGKTLEKAKKITNKDVVKSLGNLPSLKMHCSNLAADALKKAIEDYKKKSRKSSSLKSKNSS